MNSNGWICLSRKLLTWQWRDDPNMVALWVHLLLRASHETTKYHGITTHRGQVATSILALSGATGMSDKKVRVCLHQLVEDGAITTIGYKRRGTLISIVNYGQYQGGIDQLKEGKIRAKLMQCDTSNCKETETIEGENRANKGRIKGEINAAKTDYSTDSCNATEMIDGEIRANKGRIKQQYIDISLSPLMRACDACAQGGGDPGGAPPGPPEEPTVAAGGKISPADVEAAAEAIMANAAYQPLILMRSKQTAEDAAALLPEFAAQARARGRTYATPRELAEHLANWMSKKKQFENERHSSEIPRGDNGAGGGVEARAEAERDRHSDALQAAYRLMARSRRGD